MLFSPEPVRDHSNMRKSSMDAWHGTSRRDMSIVKLLGAGYFLNCFYSLALPPLFPLLKAEFAVSYGALGVVVAASSLASGIARTPIGFLVDRIGARWVLMTGLAVAAGAIGLIGVSSSYAVLLCLVTVFGVGCSGVQPSNYAILSSTVDRRRLGRAFGVNTFACHLGLLLAPATMVILTAWSNWRAAVIIVGSFGFLVVLALLLNRNLLHDEVSVRAKMARDSTANMAPKDGITLLLSAPIVLFWLFFFVASMASSGIWIFSVAALVALHQLSLASANAALTAYLFASAIGVLIGGAIADRTGRHDLLVAVALVTGAAMIAIVGALSLPMLSLVSALGIAGLMHGLIRPARDLMVRTVTPRGSIGKVFGFVTTGANLGSTVSPVLFGWMIDRGDPQGVFLLIALLMLVAVSIILAAKRLSNGIR